MFFEQATKPLVSRGYFKTGHLERVNYEPVQRNFISDYQIALLPKGSRIAFDTETYPNYFLAGFKHLDSGAYFYCEAKSHKQINIAKLTWIMWAFNHIGFNSYDYDMPLIEAAIRGASIAELKQMSDDFILRGERYRGVRAGFNHVDLINVAPLQGSLKLYAARLHTKRIQELPIDPHKVLTFEQMEFVKDYNCNDLDCTGDLFKELQPAIEMRKELGPRFNTDMRSMSDAGIAETIMTQELRKVTGRSIRPPEFDADFTFQLKRPSMLKFETSFFNELVDKIEQAVFTLDGLGYVNIPKWLDGMTFDFGPNHYRMGGGGLHTCEQQVSYYSDEKNSIRDFDVASYYPNIIINCNLFPAHIGQDFLTVYKEKIVLVRLEAKRMKIFVIADGFKIVSNGIFGKSKNRYSIVYAPEMGTFITIFGQLLLLMQIERVAAHGIHAITANTDGVVYLCPKGREAELKEILDQWGKDTGFPVEETIYKSYHARDVNNFIAIKEKGDEAARFLDERLGAKTKGAYCERGSALNSVLSHNPEHLITKDAVLHYLTKRTPLEQTIRNCNDIRRFVSVRNVRGGAHKGQTYLGRVVRWYYANGEAGEINYLSNGNKVPNTTGAKPLMELNDFPNDINYDWYVNEAESILKAIGVYGKATTQPRLF